MKNGATSALVYQKNCQQLAKTEKNQEEKQKKTMAKKSG